MPKVFNNQVFIDFLAQLRPDEQHQYNSPWNIAVDFDISMDFSIQDIRAMLLEYESDFKTGIVQQSLILI